MSFRSIQMFLLALLLVAQPASAAEKSLSQKKVLRIGAVAYAPSAVTIFNGVKKYLNKNGLPSDYVLYSNYDALVDALQKGEIDIAWSTPLAHARYHVRTKGQCRTLVMRDVDRGFRSVLVVRANADIKDLADLKGKTLVMGSCDAAEATVLPRHYLKKKGVDFDQVKVLSLDKEVDLKGNPCCSERHVLKALQEGRGDAGIIGERLWKRVSSQKSSKVQLRKIWISPEFNHCVFSASKKLDEDRANRFTKLMLAMSSTDPLTAEVMRLEGTKAWIKGTHEGFEDLIEALKQK